MQVVMTETGEARGVSFEEVVPAAEAAALDMLDHDGSRDANDSVAQDQIDNSSDEEADAGQVYNVLGFGWRVQHIA